MKLCAADPGGLALGVTIPERSPVDLDPRHGPLLIFGDSGAGRSFAVKKLSIRAADSGQKVLVLASAEYTWHRVARARGGMAVELGSGAPFPELDPDSPFLVISTCSPFPGPRTEKVAPYALDPGTLEATLGTEGGRRWLFVDNLDHFLLDEALAEYLASIWTRAHALGIYAAGTVQHYGSFTSEPRARPFLTNSRNRLFMRLHRLRSATEVARALHRDHLHPVTSPQAPTTLPGPLRRLLTEGLFVSPQAAIPPEGFWGLPPGEGFLADSVTRGVMHLYVDCTEEERRTFDARPHPYWDRPSRRTT